MEDQCLRCNNRTEGGGICRKELKQFAIVTTCSHVLCKECAEATGFVGNHTKDRQCPVCKQPLPNVDDAAQTNLRPTEEYRMSVLCGFDPATIMECASSALSFWNYQMMQETAYQQHLLLALSKKYSHLNGEIDKIIDEANNEIEGLHGKIEEISQENTNLQKRNIELTDACRERGKKHIELRKGYDVLKKIVQQNQQYPTNEAAAEQAVRSFTANPGHDELSLTLQRQPINSDATATGPILPYMLQRSNERGGVHLLQRHQGIDGGNRYAGEVSRNGRPQRHTQTGGISPVNNIPQHRTPLVAVARMAGERFQSQSPAVGNGDRVSLHNDVSARRSSHNQHALLRSGGLREGSNHMATRHAGISANMKIGGGSSIDSLIRKQTGYVPARRPNP